MLSRKILISVISSHRSLTTSCSLHKGAQLNKQVHMLKKIMSGGKEKGKRRFMFNENLPKLESVKKLSDSKGQGKESNRRITVLNKLFMKNITDLMATDRFAKNISGYGIQVSCVKVSPDFQSINVFWLAQGDENDYAIERTLKSMGGPVRHELSQLRLMGEVPRIYFVKDKYYSKAAEVDTLLTRADFGDDFEPTDPTLFMKAKLELKMKLPDDVRKRIFEAESEFLDEDVVEDELPEMRHDVLGVDHSYIMKKITVNIDKTKKAWDAFETRSETILASTEPTRDLTGLQTAVDRLNKEAEVRNEFVKFLERKQFSRRNTPERKKHKNLHSNEEDDYNEEYRDMNDSGDFIEEDLDIKK